MNYQSHYDALILRAKNRKITGYTETHHILPRCMQGGDDKENLVELTAREHFIAHQLLAKIYPENNSLIFSAAMMCRKFTDERQNNRLYEWIRIRLAKASSEKNTGRGNPFYGKKHSIETIEIIKTKARNRTKESRLHKSGRKKAVFDRKMSSEKAWITRRINNNDQMSEESIAKMKLTKANQPLEMKISRGFLGRKHSTETRAKMSISSSGRPAHNKGKLATDSHKTNISKGLMMGVEPYEGTEPCFYGCGNVALFKRTKKDTDKTVIFSCKSIHTGCPEILRKRSETRRKTS